MTRRLSWLGLIAFFGIVQAEEATAIHEVVELQGSPHKVYEALLDSKEFAAFSGLPARIDRQPGGMFSLFDGQITGRNVELIPDKRIVQAWRAASWPEGEYSIVRFELEPQGTGTRMVFDHIGFAPGLKEHLADGWQGHYFGPLKKYFGE
ncbi:MAG TPA: SRPBCC family protein [Bryobacteraceae bacterium]|nr:SRPBCC family protein [Bryobacteraceae bacterium]